MLRVLHAGMRMQGLASPAQAWLKSAQVPLDAKRQIVTQVLSQRGWLGVLKLGMGVHDVQGEALMHYLVGDRTPTYFFNAWLRLERYTHSRHRIKLKQLPSEEGKGLDGVEMHHHSLIAALPPSPAEDIVVLGVLLGLVDHLGWGELAFRWQADTPWQDWTQLSQHPQCIDEALNLAIHNKATAHWQICWGQKDMSSNEKLLGIASVHPDVSGLRYELGPWSAKVAQWLAQQLNTFAVETTKIDDAAHHLGVSARSLQRQLQAEGLRYVDVLGHVRTNMAASRLKGSTSLSEIGFVCGYTDQAHFCREFKRRVGMSPLQFRQQPSLNLTKR